MKDKIKKTLTVCGEENLLNERAYMTAYGILNEWKRESDCGDVEEGFIIGAKEGIEYCQRKVENFKNLVKGNVLLTDNDTNTLLLELIEYYLKF